MSRKDLEAFKAAIKDDFFSHATCIIRLPKSLSSHTLRYQKFVDFVRKLAIVHHNCAIRLIDGKGNTEIFSTNATDSIEDCLCDLYRISVSQLKTIECCCNPAGRSKVTCTFVMPQRREDMTPWQIEWQTARVVTINKTQLQIGHIADAVTELLSPLFSYPHFSYCLNIDVDETELESNEQSGHPKGNLIHCGIGLNEAGLLYQCCQQVVVFYKKEKLRLDNSLNKSDDHINSLLKEFDAKMKRDKRDTGKSSKDSKAVKEDLKWNLKFAEGQYWNMIINRHEKNRVTSYFDRIEELVNTIEDCDGVLNGNIQSKSQDAISDDSDTSSILIRNVIESETKMETDSELSSEENEKTEPHSPTKLPEQNPPKNLKPSPSEQEDQCINDALKSLQAVETLNTLANLDLHDFAPKNPKVASLDKNYKIPKLQKAGPKCSKPTENTKRYMKPDTLNYESPPKKFKTHAKDSPKSEKNPNRIQPEFSTYLTNNDYSVLVISDNDKTLNSPVNLNDWKSKANSASKELKKYENSGGFFLDESDPVSVMQFYGTPSTSKHSNSPQEIAPTPPDNSFNRFHSKRVDTPQASSKPKPKLFQTPLESAFKNHDRDKKYNKSSSLDFDRLKDEPEDMVDRVKLSAKERAVKKWDEKQGKFHDLVKIRKEKEMKKTGVYQSNSSTATYNSHTHGVYDWNANVAKDRHKTSDRPGPTHTHFVSSDED